MKVKQVILIFLLIGMFILSGCTTTNSIPYDPSTDNIIIMQQNLTSKGKVVSIGDINLADGVDEELLCRLAGEVKVAPGKSLTKYIADAFKEELFMAQAYSPDASTVINGKITKLNFNSFSPASWEIDMDVSSTIASGYSVSVKYPFSTSWDAYSACKNVANAFAPAVQELLKQVITHDKFSNLTN